MKHVKVVLLGTAKRSRCLIDFDLGSPLGLVCHGPDVIDQYQRAASYVDRILCGEKAVDLPVQAPTKYELIVNLKSAKALGLDIPATVLARADEVIE
jgi:putative ABC transport system substrate-binding protein